MMPSDLFRIERVGRVTWSPAGQAAIVEIRRPGQWLDPTVPTNELRLLEPDKETLSLLRAPDSGYVGFFGATWSPNGRRLIYLSIDTSGIVQPWLWDIREGARLLPDIALRSGFTEPVVAAWTDDDHVLFLAFDSTTAISGSYYFRITRGRNATEQWRRAHSGQTTATVIASRLHGDTTGNFSRLVLLDVRTGQRRTIARGLIHRIQLSPDRRKLAFFQAPTVAGLRVSSLFAPGVEGEDVYDRVHWGSVLRVIDPRTGSALATPVDLIDPVHESFVWFESGAPALRVHDPRRASQHWVALRDGRFQAITPTANDTAPRRDRPATLSFPVPHPNARVLSTSPSRAQALYVLDDVAEGTRLWMVRQGSARPTELWRGNEWLRELRTGRAQAISYAATNGTLLTGWLLLPPDYVTGRRIPIVTIVYPGQIFSTRTPSSFSPLTPDFEHPQLFAGLGYGVLMPSMPESPRPLQGDAIAALPTGVLPLLDTIVARGIADSSRIAVLGQSGGGFATLGLITLTNRFRTAIASGSYSDLLSLYGTMYGQYRYGDAGEPQVGHLLRMLQFERGYFGAASPPWEETRRYLANSPLLRAARVQTPLMLVHGDLDFIPVQQAEEFFAALYRQDKPAVLVRYHGEWHTISTRANVLDLWDRFASWLHQTMPPAVEF